MIERIGMAIARHLHKDADYGLDGETAFESRRADFIGMARAAIEAMREPTDEMIDAGVRSEWGGTLGSRVANSYRDMIDAALSQSPSLPTPAATPTDSANPPPVESVGPNSEAQS